jgi:hypothetical protein
MRTYYVTIFVRRIILKESYKNVRKEDIKIQTRIERLLFNT